MAKTAANIPAWWDMCSEVAPHVFQVQTPEKSGSGFLLRREGNQIEIATAAHVVRDAVAWQQEVVIVHPSFPGHSPVVVEAISTHRRLDVARLRCTLSDDFSIVLRDPIGVTAVGKAVKVGVEAGWAGFPANPANRLCFFSGRVSHVARGGLYYIDGVSIAGISGGPAFYWALPENELRFLGTISGYSRSRGTAGELGLMVATNLSGIFEGTS